MLDALQPFLEDKKQALALNGGDDPIRLILAYFSTDNQNIDELEKLKYNKALYRRLGWQDEEWFDCCFIFQGQFCHFCSIHRDREVEDNLPNPVAIRLLFRE